MIALGLFIIAIVAVVSLTVVFRGGDAVDIDLHWFTIHTSAGIVFLSGAVALALAAFGLSLLWDGLKRGRKRRKETKDSRQRAQAGDAAGSPAGGSRAAPGSTDATSTTTALPASATTGGAPGAAGASSAGTAAPTSSGGSGSASREYTERSGPDDHFDTAPRDT